MKNKFKKILIAVFAVLAFMFTLAGCKLGESFEDVIKDNNLVSHITYYANGEQAVFTPNYSKERNLWYPKDARPANIGVDGNLGIEYDGYEMLGWYYVALDEEGNPITTGTYTYEDERCYLYLLTDKKVDFTQRIQEGEHWIIAAKWTKISRVNVVLVHDEKDVSVSVDTNKLTTESPLYDEETETYKSTVTNGDVIQSYRYEDTGLLTSLPYNPITIVKNAHTFVAYYEDKECTKPLSFPLVKTDVDHVVYAKYITGTWTIVRTVSDVETMLDSLLDSSQRYYFPKNTVIDCNGLKVIPTAYTSCEIQGNGSVIKNLTVDHYSGIEISFFGKVEKTAKIENLAFEDFNMIYRMSKSDASIYFVFTEIETGATINNVNVKGTMKIVKPDSRTVENMSDNNGATVYTHCLFGSPYETDEEYYNKTNGNGFNVVGNPEDFIAITSDTDN